MNELVTLLEQKVGLQKSESEGNELEKALEEHISFLLDHHFEKLTWMLYRLDVDERMLRSLLDGSSERPSKIITDEVLKRCQQILQTREKYGSGRSPDLSFDV